MSDHLIEGRARVVQIDGARAWLAPVTPAACSGCATRSACATATRTSAGTRRFEVSRAELDGAVLRIGDEFEVGVDRAAVTRAGALAYGLPLAGVLLGACGAALSGAGDAAAAVVAVAGLLVGIVVARRLCAGRSRHLAPVVLGRAVRADDTWPAGG